MSRLTARARMAALAVALLLPFLAWSAPANADEPIPTTTRVFNTVYDATAHTVKVNARVTSASGIPRGSVVFYPWSSTGPQSTVPASAPVVLDGTGLASVTLPSTATIGTTPYRAEFTGTNGYADSADAPGGPGMAVTMTPEPTILKLGGPTLLKLNLTMSATMAYTDGSPAEGFPVTFTLFADMASAYGHGTPLIQPVVVCTAWSDVHGLASCGGQAAGSAIVSILTMGAYANIDELFYWSSVHEPVIVVAR